MPKADIVFRGYNVGTVAFEVGNIQAWGGPDYGELVIPVELSLRAFQPEGVVSASAITALLISGEIFIEKTQKIADFRHDLALYVPDRHASRSDQPNINVPLSYWQIHAIERRRVGDLNALLKISVVIA